MVEPCSPVLQSTRPPLAKRLIVSPWQSATGGLMNKEDGLDTNTVAARLKTQPLTAVTVT